MMANVTCEMATAALSCGYLMTSHTSQTAEKQAVTGDKTEAGNCSDIHLNKWSVKPHPLFTNGASTTDTS